MTETLSRSWLKELQVISIQAHVPNSRKMVSISEAETLTTSITVPARAS